MSSLRIESLRLVWLETFLHVTEAENLSAASRAMGVDQSTVTRHIQALEKWAGKTLVELYRGEDDGEEPGSMSRMTPAGVELLEIALEFVPKLKAFRTEEARRTELLAGLDDMIAKMIADLGCKHPSQAAEAAREQIERQAQIMALLHETGGLDLIENIHQLVRRFFADYEAKLKRERRFKRAKAKPTKSGRFIKVPPSPAK